MSGPSTYQPQNSVIAWIERRLPIFGLIHSSFVAFSPRSLKSVKVSGVTKYFWRGGRVILKTSQPIVSAVASASSPTIGSSIFNSFFPGILRGDIHYSDE